MNVSNDLSTKSGTITTNYSDKPITYLYNSSAVTLCFDTLKNITKGAYTTIATLPPDLLPSGNRIFTLSSPSGSFVRIIIAKEGDVKAFNYNDITIGNIVQCITYLK